MQFTEAACPVDPDAGSGSQGPDAGSVDAGFGDESMDGLGDSEGCSTAGVGAGSPLLVLLLLGWVRRRRRRGQQ